MAVLPPSQDPGPFPKGPQGVFVSQFIRSVHRHQGGIGKADTLFGPKPASKKGPGKPFSGIAVPPKHFRFSFF
jgi:hypothetical protein